MKKFIKIVSCVTILIFLRTGFALAADQVYYYYTDPAGTPMAMSDANGKVVWKADYMPFGEELLDTASVENNKMFVGKEKDKETGFYYFGARYMDSTAGRFVSTDPIGPIDPSTGEINDLILHNPQRLNPYTYGLNNPYRYVDADGKLAIVIIIALGVLGGFIGGNLMKPGVANGPGRPGEPTYSGPSNVEIVGGTLLGSAAGVISGVAIVESVAERSRSAARWPETPEQMDGYLGAKGERIPDKSDTPGRDKVVWKPSDKVKITYEKHPYHTEKHKEGHWHLDTPENKHQTFDRGDKIPGN